MEIGQLEYKKRRTQLMRMVGKGSIALIPSASVKTRNRDVEYKFRQDSDFSYLTGFEEPEALAVFIPGRKQGEYLLFCREFDEKTALWSGRHAGLEGALKDFGADDAFPIGDLNDILPGLLENREKVFYPMGRSSELDQQLMEWTNNIRSQARSGISAPLEFVSLEHFVHDMRLFKSPAEIKLMRKAAKISVEAHKIAMKKCTPGLYEYQIEAEFIHVFLSNGARSEAYTSIVGGGANGCVLHYIDNRDVLKDGELVLIDAGAEWKNYAADITRTFPINGHFGEAQRLLYQLVLDAQLAAIEMVKPGNHWNDPHDEAVTVLTKGLVKLGLLKGKVKKLIKEEAYKKFYMHRTGHWLGMDVHDVGDYKIDGNWRVLEPGMVLTIEPGVYIPVDCDEVDPCWRGIGIRIEDDVLITRDGHDVLSAGAPKSVGEIEAWMN